MVEVRTGACAKGADDAAPPTELVGQGQRARSVALGAWVNYFLWNVEQAWLGGSIERWRRAGRAIDEVLSRVEVALPDRRAMLAEYLRRAWDTINRIFYHEQVTKERRACDWGLHLSRLFRRDWRESVYGKRNEWLATFAPRDLLLTSIIGTLPDSEAAAFELGEVIDQGIRPPFAHLYVPVPDVPFLTRRVPRYMRGYFVGSGTIEPSWDWAGKLRRRWLSAMGVPFDEEWIHHHYQAQPNQRCNKVCGLLQDAFRQADASVTRADESGVSHLTPLNSISESSTARIREDDFTWAYANPDRPASPLLRFERGNEKGTISNAKGQTVTFDQPKPYAFVQVVYECTLEGVAASGERVDQACWGAKGPDGRKDSRSQLKTLANKLLRTIGFEIYKGSNGYVLGPCLNTSA